MKAAYSIGIIILFEGGAKRQKLLHKWELAMGTAGKVLSVGNNHIVYSKKSAGGIL